MANILWVDDDADRIIGLIKPLIKIGHKFEIAKDKKSALILLEKHKFDLIILDIIIPEWGDSENINEYVGVDLLSEKKNRICPDVPVIIPTIVNDEEVLNRIFSIGVVKTLKKGALFPSELKKIVEKILNKSEEE